MVINTTVGQSIDGKFTDSMKSYISKLETGEKGFMKRFGEIDKLLKK